MMKTTFTFFVTKPLFILAILGFLFQASSCHHAQAMALTNDGKTTFVITVAADAIPAEQTAATELQKYLQQISGVTLPVKNEAAVNAASLQILIGAGPRVKALLPAIHWEQLSADSIVIKTVGNSLVLAGGRPRGTLYAVYQFLEDQLGVRWWTPTAEFVPHQARLEIPAQNKIYTPPFETREIFTDSVQNSAPFAARLKINGNFQPQDAVWGGHNAILGWCHTFSQGNGGLITPQKYFKEHPEWFSDPLNGNKPCTSASTMPDAGKTQLNLTDAALRQQLTQNALEWLRANPGADTISISQNDNVNWCHSPEEIALNEKEGSPAGALIYFVNAVAANIEKEFPKVKVDTLAYDYTVTPPRYARPRHNVVIRLCTVNVDMARPLDSAGNTTFHNELTGWKRIAPALYIWNYAAGYSNLIYPFPNLDVYQSNLRLFADNNVKSVFLQGDAYTNGTGDFVQLRTWVQAHLLWNPQLDENQLIDEFLNGYYGKAAPYIKQYINLLQQALLQTGQPLHWNSTRIDFLSPSVLNQATCLFNQAEQAVPNASFLLRRIQRSRLELDYAWILHYQRMRDDSAQAKKAFLGPSDIQQFVTDFIKTMQHLGIRDYAENKPFTEYATMLKARFEPQPPLPPHMQSLIPTGSSPLDVINLTPDRLLLNGEGIWVQQVDDPLAFGGRAARMPGNHTEWAVQYNLTSVADIDSSWHVYALARVDVAPDTAQNTRVLMGGVYPGGEQDFNYNQVGSDKYYLVDLGIHPAAADTYVWFSPVNNPAIANVYIERIVLIRQP